MTQHLDTDFEFIVIFVFVRVTGHKGYHVFRLGTFGVKRHKTQKGVDVRHIYELVSDSPMWIELVIRINNQKDYKYPLPTRITINTTWWFYY